MLRIFGASRKTPTASLAQTAAASPVNDQDLGAVATLNEVEISSKATAGLQPPTQDRSNQISPARTDKGGISSKSTAEILAVGLRLFVQSGYVTAMRPSDGTMLSRGVAAQPADLIELYATGCGPAPAAMDSGGGGPSNVRVSIGNMLADVRFAGRVGPGLYQINLVVPDLPGGDHPVIASVAGMSTPCQGLIKIGHPQATSCEAAGRYEDFMRKAIEEDAVLEGETAES
jgi:uncharacterized protein (TIGR03437 family)